MMDVNNVFVCLDTKKKEPQIDTKKHLYWCEESQGRSMGFEETTQIKILQNN
jgi:hypothetical protein